jgi:hypothetical protein
VDCDGGFGAFGCGGGVVSMLEGWEDDWLEGGVSLWREEGGIQSGGGV